MTSLRLPAPIDIRLRPSRLLSVYLIVLAGLLLFAIAQLPLPLWAVVALNLCCLTLFLHYWRCYVRLKGNTAVRGICYREQTWQLLTERGFQRADCRAATIWPWLVALDMRIGARSMPVLVLRDSTTAEELRRLRQLVLLIH